MKLINSIMSKFTGLDKQKTIIQIVISFLVLCVMVYFVFLPAFRESQLLSNQIKEKKINLNRVKIPRGEFDSLTEKKGKAKNELEILKKKLFWEKDISKFLNELTQLASDLPMEFVSLKPEPALAVSVEKDKKEKDKKDKKVLDYSIMQVPILVVLKADYNSLVSFLKRIEEAERFISIDTFNIESDTRDVYKQNIKTKLIIFIKAEG